MKTAFLVVSFLAATFAHAIEKTESVIGTPQIVHRTFSNVTPAECLALLPTSGTRQAWKCVFVYPGSKSAYMFNPALVYNEEGGLFRDSDIRMTIESHPNGGSLGFFAPGSTPGTRRMIPYAEIKTYLERAQSESRKFQFRGTFLAIP